MNLHYGICTSILTVMLMLFVPPVYSQSTLSDSSRAGFRNSSAIDTLQAKHFNQGLILSVPELLIGRVPGFIVSQPGSNPDEITDLRIRGFSSIVSATAPLIVIDEIITKDFSSIDPLDIQQIEILKDAASSVRYGVLGNAGVIRITTKRGKYSTPREKSVKYHGTLSSSTLANQIDVLNAEQYRLFNSLGFPFSGTDFGSDTNWQKEITQNGISQFHNLSITGGNESTTYRLSGISRDNETILKGSDNQQLRARAHFTHKALNDNLMLSGSVSLSAYESSFGLEEIFRYATTFNPTAPIKDADGSYFETGAFDTFNPVSMLEQSKTVMGQQQNQFRLSGQYDLGFVTDGLSTKVLYSHESQNINRSEYYGKNLQFRGGDRNGLVLLSDRKIEHDFLETYIQYQIQTGRSQFKAQTGLNTLTSEYSEKFTSASNFLSDIFFYNSIGNITDPDEGVSEVETIQTDHSMHAYFGQVDASYDDTFFGTFILRREGSTRFGANNKWGTFYGMSAGVEWTNIVDVSVFDQAYIRAGYGKTGQDAPFNGISQLRFGNGPYFFNGREFVPSIHVVNNPNPELKWEEKKEFNVGADLAVFDNRFTLSIDYFRNRVDDLLYEIPVDVPPNLFDRKWVNIGEIKNSGLEVRLDYHTTFQNNANWSSTLLYATSSSRLVSLSNSEYSFDESPFVVPGAPGMGSAFLMQLVEGGKFGDFIGPEFAGFDSEGRWEFVNAEGAIVSGDQLTENDNRVIGNGLPDFTFGWMNSFSLSNWDVEVFWQGVFGHDMINTYNLFYANPTSIGGNYNITESARDLPLRESPIFSDYYVEDATYFRLQNVTIGYDFNLPDGASVKQLRIYSSGTNLWTLTGYTGVDPEVRLSSFPPTSSGTPQSVRSVLSPGIERRNIWPTQTSILFGVQMGF